MSSPLRGSAGLAALALLVGAAGPAAAQTRPPPCAPDGLRVVRSTQATTDYLGSVPGIPELCHMRRSGDGEGTFYLGLWRSDWPGAGLAYPAIRAAIHGQTGTRTQFVTRSYPGMQWLDSYENQGIEPVVVDGVRHAALRLAHEREGIEGNTYHSIITSWIDVESGAVLRTHEYQIAGQSYGPATTWQAVRIEGQTRGGS